MSCLRHQATSTRPVASDHRTWSFTVPHGQAPDRLDRWLAAQSTKFSRTRIQSLIQAGNVTVDGQPARAATRLKAGQLVTMHLTETSTAAPWRPYALDLEVLYEDEVLAVIDKPPHLVMHPAPGHTHRTLANALMYRWSAMRRMGPDQRLGIVHRLDRDTSGLVLVARTHQALEHLQAQFQQRTVHKGYTALLDGFLTPAHGCVNVPLGRHPKHRQRQAAFPQAPRPLASSLRTALTCYQVNGYCQSRPPSPGHPFTQVAVAPQTGRTHQIRVHMAYLGCPVVGDTTYGLRKPRLILPRHFLHASSLAFDHPVHGERMCFTAALPQDLAQCLASLDPVP